MSTELDELLRTMPRERAPETFARDVVARLECQSPTARPARFLALAGAVVAVALLVAGATWWSRLTTSRELRAEIAALRAQHQALQDQLSALRERVAAQEPLLVGGTDRVDYVVDVNRLSDLAAAGGAKEAIWVPQPSGGSL